MNPETIEKIKFFVAKEARVNRNKLTSRTSVLQDLGIDGDDAVDFLNAFSKEFRVDLSELDPKQYFGPEGWGPSAILLWLLSLIGIQNSEVVPIYLSDLAEAVEAGKWTKKHPSESSSGGKTVS